MQTLGPALAYWQQKLYISLLNRFTEMNKPSVCRGLCAVILLWLTAGNTFARTGGYTNLGTENGLPSNHVYFLLKDTYGYLWMATEKGVVKYNGYTLKKFGLTEGLSTDDVWYIYEDGRRRVWLATLGNEMGYLYNDTYTALGIKTQNNFLRPQDFFLLGNNIVFSSKTDSHSELYFENNDSFYRYRDPHKGNGYLGLYGNNLMRVHSDGIYTWRPGRMQFHKLFNYDMSFLFVKNTVLRRYADFFVAYPVTGTGFVAYNVRRRQKKAATLATEKDEYIYTSYPRDSTLWMVTNRHVYCLDRQLNIQRVYNTDSLIPGASAGDEICINILEDPFWQRCFSTRYHGIYLYNQTYPFRPVAAPGGAELHYAGKINDTAYLWYDNTSGNMYTVNDRMELQNRLPLKSDGPVRITHTTRDSSLLAMGKQLYWITGDNRIALQLKKNTPYTEYRQDIPGTKQTFSLNFPCGAIYACGAYFFVSENLGFCRITRGPVSVNVHQLWNRKLNIQTYDPYRQAIWVSSNNEIMVYRSGIRLVIGKNILRGAGIRKIEQLLIDANNGNVYIKDYSGLFYYNPHRGSFTRVLTHYNMEGALVTLSAGSLIVAGRFGLVTANLEKPDSAMSYYPNIRNAAFSNVNEMQTSRQHIVLKTDKGFFIVSLVGDCPAATADIAYRDMKLLVKYEDSLYSTQATDVLRLHHQNLSLQLDAINPSGTGNLRFQYRIGEDHSGWKDAANNQVYLHGLEPGRHYTLFVAAADDIMTSNAWCVRLYVLPLWWQTSWGGVVVWLLVLAILTILIVLTIIITSRLARRRNAHRNMELELKSLRLETELKSVYAQINPHFIFNTLSTTAYFIKKNNTKEANRHIVAFSRLLRSYIHSSRNKFITLETEIENIGNYILLQQVRFEDKFSYRLYVDEGLNPAAFKIPAMLLQPLVENAINHGLLHKNGPGVLTIRFLANETQDELYCIIDDDGIGREASRRYKEENNINTSSYGTDLITDLIAVVNTYHELSVSIGYTDKTPPDSGTTVTLTIKYDRRWNKNLPALS